MARHRWQSWLGIALILLNVLAPGVSHALRVAGGEARTHQHEQLVLAVAGDWCAINGSVTAGELKALSHHIALADAVGSLKACDFCDDTLLSSALPVPVLTGLSTVPPLVLRSTLPSEDPVPARRHAHDRPVGRAPPSAA